jgi:RND family efflux transporter MFP subunit
MSQDKPTEQKRKSFSHFKWFVIGCIATAVIAVGFWLVQAKRSRATEQNNTVQETKRIPVVVAYPVRRTFEQKIVTQGNVEAKNIAMVSPRIPGTLEEIFVDEGDRVTAGQTELFHTDDVKIQQSVIISEHDLAVARCAERQAQANLEKVIADFNKAELDFKRFERLLEKDATTQDMFEQQQSRYIQLAAARKLAAAQVELAAEKVRQAEAALTIAGKDLTDTSILAPISGKVSMRLADPGEMGSPGHPVIRIEDTSLLEVSAFLPAAAYPSVTAGQTQMRVTVSGIDLGPRTISYKSPTIQPKLRTFEVKCLLEDPPEGIAPGAMADIAVILMSREGLGVPSAAIQQRAGRSVIFVVEGDTAHQIDVQTGLDSNGLVELLDGNVTEASSVVTMGQYQLDDGVAVSIQKGAN